MFSLVSPSDIRMSSSHSLIQSVDMSMLNNSMCLFGFQHVPNTPSLSECLCISEKYKMTQNYGKLNLIIHVIYIIVYK